MPQQNLRTIGFLIAVGRLVVAVLLSIGAGCRAGPILGTASESSVGGTIAGAVRATGGTVPLVGRVVTAIDVATGARYETSTSTTGGYTLKVPEGTYRLEVELRDSEAIAKRPDNTQVNNGDLDPDRDFDVTVKPVPRAAVGHRPACA